MTTPPPSGKPSPEPPATAAGQAENLPTLPPQSVQTRPNWGAGIIGFAFGAVLVIALLGVAIGNILGERQAQAVPTRVAARVTPKIWPTPTPTPLPPQSDPEIQPTPDVIRVAQEMIDGGQSQGAVGLLGPQVDQLATEALRKTAYQLLAQAELNLSNYNLAAAYFEKARAIQSDPLLLWSAADAYDQGGSLECALDRYQAVLKQREPVLDAMRPTAEARVAALRHIFPTQIPCK